MLGIDVKATTQSLVIKYQLTKVEIPLSDITEVTLDDTYGGIEREAIRIGAPYRTTDRVVIKTHTQTYILFTTNYQSIMNTIQSSVAKRG